MFKAQFAKERLDGYGVAIGAEFVIVKVQHPYNKFLKESQPTFAMTLRFLRWQLFMMIYKPANIKLNRAQRRANHLH